MSFIAPTDNADLHIITTCDRGDPAPFWVRRLAAVLPRYSHVELAPQPPARRNIWAARLDGMVRSTDRPVILMAYGVSCHAVSWWARLSPRVYVQQVAAAVLFRPTDVPSTGGGYAGPGTPLPFLGVVVDDSSDDARSAVRSRRFARGNGLPFADLPNPGLAALVPEPDAAASRENLVLALLREVTGWLQPAAASALPLGPTPPGGPFRPSAADSL